MFFFDYIRLIFDYKNKFKKDKNKLKLTEELISDYNNLTVKKTK